MYRCSSIKSRSKNQCEQKALIEVSSAVLFIVYHNEKFHSCGDVASPQKAKTYLSDELKYRIDELFRAGVRMPKRLLRILRDEKRLGNLNYESEPTINQIKYRVSLLKKQLFGDGEITLSELREYLRKLSIIPDDEDEPYCIAYKVLSPIHQTINISENDDTDYEDDSDDDGSTETAEEPYFYCLFSTKRLLKITDLTSTLCADSTFKLVWQGFSGILLGTVDMKKQFHKFAFGISSREKIEDWQSIFEVNIRNIFF